MDVGMHACKYVCMDVCMHAWMYVCMHGCMYACMHVCMDVCMHGCMHVSHVCMHVCMHGCMHVWMHACMLVCMHVWMHGCMYAFMDVCMHVLHLSLSTYLYISTPTRCTNPDPMTTSKTSARQRSQLAFRVNFEVAIYVAGAEDTPVEAPNADLCSRNIPLDQLSSLCSSMYYYEYGII